MITVGTTRPYPETGLSTATWMQIEPEWVHWRDLITTQGYVSIPALLGQVPPHGVDPFPHVVEWDGRLYLEDGHNRVVRNILLRPDLGVGQVRVFRR